MELTPKELMKQYVDSQNFTSTTQIMQAMKEKSFESFADSTFMWNIFFYLC